MKKYQYIVAAACVLVGAIGFASMYATSQSQNQQNELVQQEKELEQEKAEEIVKVPEVEMPEVHDDPLADVDYEAKQELELELEEQDLENQDLEDQEVAENDLEDSEAEVGTIQEEVFHLNADEGIMWPIEGNVLMDYSMDSTIFFPTLQQYQYNPSMIFAAEVNDKVYFVAKGKITSIETNEETGCTVMQDIGDGYTAVYGQLKELNFEVGDTVQCGQVVGYVSEPTKYYSVEGANVYFQLLKDGVPVDPEEIFP